MWLEIKSLLTVTGIVFVLIATVMGATTVLTILLVFMGVSAFMFGDILLGYQITSKEIKPQIDPTPSGQELTIFQEIGGKIHFKNTNKAEMGIRKFLWHNKVGAVINDGVGMFTLPNGNRGFFSHESYDKSISLLLCKALETISKKTDSNDIKEIYDNTMKEVKKLEEARVHFND